MIIYEELRELAVRRATSGRSTELSRCGSSLARQLAHGWLRTLERVTQLDQVGQDNFGNRVFDMLWCDAIVADEERDVRHVLRIVAAHHLGKDQIERGGAEES